MTFPLRQRALEILQAHWRPDAGYRVPNPARYPHQWLWDSAFHSVAWARLGDVRGVTELSSLLGGQLDCGMVPHMRYGPAPPSAWLGPLASVSSITQPPMFGHAIAELLRSGFEVSRDDVLRATRALRWLLDFRRDSSGLIFIVHPWEAGNDHAPRWDGWGVPGTTPDTYDQSARSPVEQGLDAGCGHRRVMVRRRAPPGLWSARPRSTPTSPSTPGSWAPIVADRALLRDADELAQLIDELLWDENTNLWADRPVVGGDGRTHQIPISDGAMPLLVSDDRELAQRALGTLIDPHVFGGTPFGPTNVARDHPSYDPTAYWRGAAWPNMSYLLWLAARRWGNSLIADEIAQNTIAGAEASGWAEYWNPQTGEGLGAAPQSWTALAATMARGEPA